MTISAVVAFDIPKRIKPSNYPPPFASQMDGRSRLSPEMCAEFKNLTLDKGTEK